VADERKYTSGQPWASSFGVKRMPEPKIDWYTQYGSHIARVGRLGTLEVNWSNNQAEPGYRVSAFGVMLKKLFSDANEGKEAAVRLARKLVYEAGEALGMEVKAS